MEGKHPLLRGPGTGGPEMLWIPHQWSVQGQAEWDPWEINHMGGIPAHGRGAGMR